jgi:hypothetical protein
VSNPVDLAEAIKRFAVVARQAAEDAGTDCDLPGCNALTLGVRCHRCHRRMCQGHALWTLGSGVTATCLYCLIEVNGDLFDGDEDEEEDEGGDVVDNGDPE